MAMQTLHQESGIEIAAPVEHDIPDAPAIDQTRVYAQEVRSLRQRVAVLEAELAAAKAAEQLSKTPPLTSIDFTPAAPASPPAPPVLSTMVVSRPESPSVFTHEITPAVQSVAPKPPTPEEVAPQTAASQTAASQTAAPQTAGSQTAASAEPVSNPGFAEAWSQEPDATFAERVAEKAFFQATSIDEESRSWLLES